MDTRKEGLSLADAAYLNAERNEGLYETIIVYSLAVDGPKCGTTGGAYATERDAFLALIEQAGLDEDEKMLATAYFDAGPNAEEGWIEYVQSCTDLLTWQIEESKIEVPIIRELVEALESATESLEMFKAEDVPHYKKIIGKAKGGL
jgi:hypothetical protein